MRVLFIGIVYVCVRARAHAVLCASVFDMFCMKMLIFVLYACILLICISIGICALYVFL